MPTSRGFAKRSAVSEQTKRVLAIVSVVVGLLGIGCAVCFAACGAVVGIGGLVCGILAIRSESKVLAIVGVVVNTFALLAACGNMGWMAYRMKNGEDPFQQFRQHATDAGVPDAPNDPDAY